MSEILFSYESSPSFAGPYTARGRSVTVYADGLVAGCGVFTRMKKEANLKNLQLAERIMQILDSHKQELEEIPELLDTRVMDGSIDTFCFGEKRITGLQLSRHETELDESPAVFKKPDVRFYVNAVLDIYDEIVDVGIEYGINLRIR